MIDTMKQAYDMEALKQAYALLSKSISERSVPHWTPWTRLEPECPIPQGTVIRRQVLILESGMDSELVATIRFDGPQLRASINLGPGTAHPFARFGPEAWDEAMKFVDGQLSFLGHILL